MQWTAKTHRFGMQAGHLEVCCYGPGPDVAPTLVLLHEGLGCLARWRDFPERLAREANIGVLAYSRFGYGRSSTCTLPRPLDYMTDEAVNVLPVLLAAYGVRDFSLAGHSDGASIATIYAARVQPPSKLVLLAPHFFVEPCSVLAIADARGEFEQGDLANRMDKYHDDVDAAFWGWCDAWLDPDFIEHWNIERDIEAIDCPVLALQGITDSYGTVEQYRGWRGRPNFRLLTTGVFGKETDLGRLHSAQCMVVVLNRKHLASSQLAPAAGVVADPTTLARQILFQRDHTQLHCNLNGDMQIHPRWYL